jgi:hypothetical protein
VDLEPVMRPFQSPTLAAFVGMLPADCDVKITSQLSSPWVIVDVFGRTGWVPFAIWKTTDVIYGLEVKDGPPYPVEDEHLSLAAALMRVVGEGG